MMPEAQAHGNLDGARARSKLHQESKSSRWPLRLQTEIAQTTTEMEEEEADFLEEEAEADILEEVEAGAVRL